MLNFEITCIQYFCKISVKISPKNKKMDIFKNQKKQGVEKCPRWNFQKPGKLRNQKGKANSFVGYPLEVEFTFTLEREKEQKQ